MFSKHTAGDSQFSCGSASREGGAAKNPSLTILVIFLFMLLASCDRHPAAPVATNSGPQEEGHKQTDVGSESGNQPQPGVATGQPGEAGPGKYEHLREYTFFVPDQWVVAPWENYLDGLDPHLPPELKQQILALNSGHILYLAYPDEKHEKAHILFIVSYDTKLMPWHKQSAGFKADHSRQLGDELHAEVKLVESKEANNNTLESAIHHYSFSSLLRSGDVILGYFHKGRSTLWVKGEFSQPLYPDLLPTITTIMESIRQEEKTSQPSKGQ